MPAPPPHRWSLTSGCGCGRIAPRSQPSSANSSEPWWIGQRRESRGHQVAERARRAAKVSAPPRWAARMPDLSGGGEEGRGARLWVTGSPRTPGPSEAEQPAEGHFFQHRLPRAGPARQAGELTLCGFTGWRLRHQAGALKPEEGTGLLGHQSPFSAA